MTQVLSAFRFRRWSQEKKTNVFRLALNTLFAVFLLMAVFTVWQVAGKSTVAGIAVAAVLLVALIAFDIVVRSAMFLSTSYSTQYEQHQAYIRDEQAKTQDMRNDMDGINKDRAILARENDRLSTKFSNIEDKFQELKQLMFKKRKGKTPRVSKSVKKALSSIEDLL